MKNNRTIRYTRKQFKKSDFIITVHYIVNKARRNKEIPAGWVDPIKRLARLGERFQYTTKILADRCSVSIGTMNRILTWCRENNLLTSYSRRIRAYCYKRGRYYIRNSPNIYQWITTPLETVCLDTNNGNSATSSLSQKEPHYGTLYKYNDNKDIFIKNESNRIASNLAVDNNDSSIRLSQDREK